MAQTKLEILLALSDKVTKPFRSSMTQMQKHSAKFMQGFRQNWLLITAAITGAIIVLNKFSKAIITAADKVQQYSTRLKVLLGTMEEGNQVFEDMTELASEVPKTYDEIMASATDLSAVVSGGSEEIKKLMPIIVDLSAGTGMSVREVTGQMIRMYSAGAAAADMFRERGVSAALGFQAGATISAKETMKVIVDQWEDGTGKFVGASEELKKTWTGATSMMQDAWFQLRAEIGLGVIESEAVNKIMQDITGTIADMAAEVKTWREAGGVELFLVEWALRIDNLTLSYGSLLEGVLRIQHATAILSKFAEYRRAVLTQEIEEVVAANTGIAIRILQLEQEKKALMDNGAEILNLLKVKARSFKTEEDLAKEKAAREKKVRDQEFKDTAKSWQDKLAQAQTYYGMLGKTVAMAAAQNKDLAILNKAVQIGQTLINTASAVMKTMAIYGPTPLGFSLAAAVSAMGATQAAIIASQEMHTGGVIRAHDGMSLARDEVPIIAQTGEGVLSRRGMSALGGSSELNRLNAGSGGGTNIIINMDEVSFRSEDDIDDVMDRLSNLIVTKKRS